MQCSAELLKRQTDCFGIGLWSVNLKLVCGAFHEFLKNEMEIEMKGCQRYNFLIQWTASAFSGLDQWVFWPILAFSCDSRMFKEMGGIQKIFCHNKDEKLFKALRLRLQVCVPDFSCFSKIKFSEMSFKKKAQTFFFHLTGFRPIYP